MSTTESSSTPSTTAKPTTDQVFKQFLQQSKTKKEEQASAANQSSSNRFGGRTLSSLIVENSLPKSALGSDDVKPTTFTEEELDRDDTFTRVQKKYHLRNVYRLMNMWSKCSSLPQEPIPNHPFVTNQKSLDVLKLACNVSGMLDRNESLNLANRCLPSTVTINAICGLNAQNVLTKEEALDMITQCSDCLEGNDRNTQAMKQVYLETTEMIQEPTSLNAFLPKVSSILSFVSDVDGMTEGPQAEKRELFAVNTHHDSNKKIISKLKFAQANFFKPEFNEMSKCLEENENNVNKCKFETMNYTTQTRAVACSREISQCLDNFSSIAAKLHDYQKRHTKSGAAIGFGSTFNREEEEEDIFGDEEEKKPTTVKQKKQQKKSKIPEPVVTTPPPTVDEDANDEGDDGVFGADNEDYNDSYNSSSVINSSRNRERKNTSTSSSSIIGGLFSSSNILKASQKQKEYEETIEFVGNSDSAAFETTPKESKNEIPTKDDMDNIERTTMERFTKCMSLYQPTISCLRRVDKALQNSLSRAQRANGKKKKKAKKPKSPSEQMYHFADEDE
ncbi:predicted protein [Naegleria gruberi]|uniref:Predicted protein n=1 Tax=Naegleria gruberi TaxID=5762 RepID=D2VRS0_NAEGR|nr:uncharacterized protein NAEGRDRAFT_51741 [Naegleria gruberi]EFC40439.1 predicted protein [Naegleria gruberi]|eukprot:XP_002673183.1 predicted protein [Naegleria gruberi strain NEG-M]